MVASGNFTTTTIFSVPSSTAVVLTLATPSAVITQVTVSSFSYNVTVLPTAIMTPVTLSDNGTAITPDITVPVPSSKRAGSSSPAVPAALGAVLGVVAIASIVIISLLFMKNRRLLRAAEQGRESYAPGQADSDYALYGKEAMNQEESPEQLRRQLGEVRQELAAVSVLAPSTIRDQSDYMRDLSLLNDNIRQLAMRISRGRPDTSASGIRSDLCNALWSCIFAKFDASLDPGTDQQMLKVLNSLSKPGSGILWRAMTVQSLELANPSIVAEAVKRDLSPALNGAVPSRDIVEVAGQALRMSRMLAEDGKGFTISYAKDAQVFGLMSGTTTIAS